MESIPNKEFFNLYHQGFIRAALCIPAVKVADPFFNANSILQLARTAADRQAILAIFPELSLSAYSNEDLFHQDALLQSVLQALARMEGELSNCRRGAACARGRSQALRRIRRP